MANTPRESPPDLSGTGSGAAGVRGLGHFSMAVGDIEQAVQFFSQAFGFTVVYSEFGMNSQIEAMTGATGLQCHLIQIRHPGSSHLLELIEFVPEDGKIPADELPIRPGASHVSLVVEDIDTARIAVEDQGGSVLGDITKFESGPALYCQVPGGVFVELEQRVNSA